MAKQQLNSSSPTTSNKLPKRSMSPREILSPEPSAVVSGLLTSLSPSKPKETTFYGELSDGEAVIPLVGFDKAQWRKLEHFRQSQKPLSLINCQITLNKTTGKPQVVVKNYTAVQESPNTGIHINDPNTLASPILPISHIGTLDEYDRVTVRAAVLKVKDPQSVSKGKTKQEIIVADESGTIPLTLWEEDIGILVQYTSYQLNRVQVHKFLGKYELTFPRFGASFHEIEDLQDVCQYTESNNDLDHVTSATIVVVGQLESTVSCISCKKNMCVTIESDIIECNSCDTKQRARNIKTTAKLYVEDGCQNSFSFRAYQDMLTEIAQTPDVTSDNLLQSEPFDLTFNKYHIITSITRL